MSLTLRMYHDRSGNQCVLQPAFAPLRGGGLFVARWSRSTKLLYAAGPVSTAMVDRFNFRCKKPVLVQSHLPMSTQSGIPPWAVAMSTSQRAVILCGCGVKAGGTFVGGESNCLIP